MAGHVLGHLDRAAVLEEDGDAGCTPAVVTDRRRDPRFLGASLQHIPSVGLGHAVLGELTRLAASRPEQGSALDVGETRCREVRVHVLLKHVVNGDLFALAAFLPQSHRPLLALRVVVADVHGECSADPGEGIRHQADKCTVAQADETIGRDAVDELRDLLGRQVGSLALGNGELGAAHGGGGVLPDDLVDEQPVEQHAQRRQRLLDRRGLERTPAHHLDVGGDVLGADVADVFDAVVLNPSKKETDLTTVASSGVTISDARDEEI